MAYTTIPPSSAGGIPAWLNTVLTRARAVSASLVTPCYANDFGQTALSTSTVSAGTIVFTDALDGGVADMQTTAINGRNALLSNAGNAVLVAAPATSPFYIHCRAKIATATDAQASILPIGLLGSTQSIDFGTHGAVDTANLSMQLIGGGTTNVTSTTAIDTAAYHDYAISFDLTTVVAYVDGVVVCSTTTLTNLTAQIGFAYAFVKNGTTAANRQLLVDNMAVITKQAA